MKKEVLFFIILIFVVVIGFLYNYAVSSPYRITPEEAKVLIKNKDVDLILDVRTDFERETLGSYPGSIHIQAADLESRMPLQFPDKSIKILAYCNTGQRARKAVEKLQELGYKNTHYISTTYTVLLS
jgi:rhodanese-related sulfurtransferase